MLKNGKFEVKKTQLNKIIFKNGCLMREDNTESFQEKKFIQNILIFHQKSLCQKKGFMWYHPLYLNELRK